MSAKRLTAKDRALAPFCQVHDSEHVAARILIDRNRRDWRTGERRSALVFGCLGASNIQRLEIGILSAQCRTAPPMSRTDKSPAANAKIRRYWDEQRATALEVRDVALALLAKLLVEIDALVEQGLGRTDGAARIARAAYDDLARPVPVFAALEDVA